MLSILFDLFTRDQFPLDQLPRGQLLQDQPFMKSNQL